MEPVRVKLYGLVSVTKRGYLTQQVIAFALLVFLFIISLALPESPRQSKLGNLEAKEASQRVKPSQSGPARDTELPPWVGPLFWLVDNLRWIVLAAFAWFAIETCVVLRRFAQKAAVQQARSPGSSSS